MIKIERTSVMNFENAIRGARNPMNSWGRMDSHTEPDGTFVDLETAECGKSLCVFLHGVTPIFFFELTDANQLYLQHIVSLC